MSEDADLRVGEHQAAHEIVSQVTLNPAAERFCSQTSPSLAREIIECEAPRHLLFRNERLEHAVPRLFGEYAGEIVKLLQLLVLAFAAGKIDNRAPAFFFIDIADEQSVVFSISSVRRKRGDRAPAQLELQTELANDFLWKEANQISVARQPRVIIRKH